MKLDQGPEIDSRSDPKSNPEFLIYVQVEGMAGSPRHASNEGSDRTRDARRFYASKHQTEHRLKIDT